MCTAPKTEYSKEGEQADNLLLGLCAVCISVILAHLLPSVVIFTLICVISIVQY